MIGSEVRKVKNILVIRSVEENSYPKVSKDIVKKIDHELYQR